MSELIVYAIVIAALIDTKVPKNFPVSIYNLGSNDREISTNEISSDTILTYESNL